MSQYHDLAAPNNESVPQQQPVETLWVELGERKYPIHIGAQSGEALAASLARSLTKGGKCVAVIDSNFHASYPRSQAPLLPAQVPPLDIAIDGEPAKSITMLNRIYDLLAAEKVGRDGGLVAIGGGVTGDLAGFAAATYLRGIDLYQVPTTLLAMVDSSVGGKTGINIAAGKNLVGAFWQPKAVFICTDFLKTLPPREFAAGVAEIIKYGMLHDVAFFETLEAFVASGRPLSWDHPALPQVIRRCCEIKAEIVGEDERETKKEGGRALLNLGHTFAHAIENAAGYGTYLHGEAVGIGLVMAARLSEELTLRSHSGYHFTAQDVERVTALVRACQLPTALNQLLGTAAGSPGCEGKPVTTPQVTPPPLPLAKLQQAMGLDKKTEGGTIRFVAMQRLGVAVKTPGVDAALIDALWREFGAEG